MAIRFQDIEAQPDAQQRNLIRNGDYQGPTSGLMKGRLQCNLVILRGADAEDFKSFCERNPKSCPLAGYSEMGSPHIERIGGALDMTRDASLYNVYRDGQLQTQKASVSDEWQEDMTAFAIGCSFTFENALIEAGIEVRHISLGLTVPMYRSHIQTNPAGAFRGESVVSMRPIKREKIDEVIEICGQFPIAHGMPIHVGAGEAIGVKDISQPDWGDAIALRDDELPVFWLCGVTPQVAIMNARPRLAMTHAPGAMLIADVPENLEPAFPYQDQKPDNKWREQ